MTRKPRLHLFEGYGIEVEYMLVRADSLEVLPISDEILKAAAGRYTNETESGDMGWSNEFVMHVMEIRNSTPSPSLSGLESRYQREVEHINRILDPMGGRLMPGSMHPWMNPEQEAVLWHRRNREIYRTYDRIFGCKTHGWANIQSTQINLPFSGNDEFARLHAAVRLMLPIIPALAASSPVFEGTANGIMDNRLRFYRENQRKILSIAGSIIPEQVFSIERYKKDILERMYRDIAPFDPDGILQHEWLNSRGAIPRYDRNAIEVRLPDIQECPLADMAIMTALAAGVRALVHELWSELEQQQAFETGRLVTILDEAIQHAEDAVIKDTGYLSLFGISEKRIRAGDLWSVLIGSTLNVDTPQSIRDTLQVISEEGPLSRRIIKALDGNLSIDRIREVYGVLCTCLADGELFHG